MSIVKQSVCQPFVYPTPFVAYMEDALVLSKKEGGEWALDNT